MGDYLAWVQAGPAENVAASKAASAPAAAPAAKANPQAAPAAAKTPASPAAPQDAPSWFTTQAREENGRVMVGAMADAPSVREAPRMAAEAGKAALAGAMGVEPADVRLESTYVKKQGEGYRAYVLISCAGTIKK
jgi:hypothetical protein